MKRFWPLVSALVLGCSAVVCAAQTTAPPAPAPAAEAPPPQPSGIDENSYLIGPGDALQVFVWRNPELSTSVPVRPDGKISTPLAEDVVAVGKTPTQLAREIEKVLANYIRSPQVNVIVSNPVSTFSQIKIIGQVTTPQAIAYREGMMVLDAVLAVGGLSEFAAGNKAKIVRTENGKPKEIRVRLDDLVNKGDMKQNLPMRPGDVLVVPESIF